MNPERYAEPLPPFTGEFLVFTRRAALRDFRTVQTEGARNAACAIKQLPKGGGK